MMIIFRHVPSFLTYLTLTTLRAVVVSILLVRTLMLRWLRALPQVHTFSHPSLTVPLCLREGKPLAEAQGEAVSEMGPEYGSSDSSGKPWLSPTVQDISGLETETSQACMEPGSVLHWLCDFAQVNGPL